MKSWLQFHFLGSRGFTTYVQKLNMATGVWSRAMRHTLLFFTRLTDAFLNVFGTFLPRILHFLSTSFIFPPVLLAFFCLPRCFSASISLLPCLSELGLSDGDIVAVYECRHRHGKDKRQHLVQRKPRWLLDPGRNKRQEHLTTNGGSKLHLQQRRQSLFLPLSYTHTQTHTLTQQALR